MKKYFIMILIVSSLFFLSMDLVQSNDLSQDDVSPGLRSAAGMAYDPINNVTVLYGGTSFEGGIHTVSDTWFYDYAANTWTEYSGISPPARANTDMVYCSQTNEILLFGGFGVTDTWSLNCETQTWSEVITTMNPGVHHSLALAYDPIENVVILFGGFDDTGWTTDDTWSFDCETRQWTDLSPSVTPISRYGHVMTYDTNISKIVMACGNSEEGHKDDTWTFDVSTNTWTEIDPTGTPDPLKWPSMVYDPINKRSILFGGQIGDNAVDETHVFDAYSSTWANPSPEESPPPRINSGFAFDSKYGVAILYGGLLIDETNDITYQLEDTWSYSYSQNNWTNMNGVEHTPPSISTTDTNSNTDSQQDLTLILIAVPLITVAVIVLAYFIQKYRK